ncbi:MAG: Rrf2 family transcriptional regulator [Candidatus Cloacimonetes bacterium]|nr:Rrf2 family transcriptional regulator [Candidatus Cloacimonadota bacterium]
MAVNTRTEYALRALLEIADSPQDAVSAQKICENQGLPKKYIERLLSNLKTAGLVTSSAGSRGGYALAKDARDITLQHILVAVADDSLDPTCNASAQRFCPTGNCALSSFFAVLGGKVKELLSGYTLETIYKSWKGSIDGTRKNISR